MKGSSYIIKAAPLGLFLLLCGFLAIGLTKDPRALPSNLIDKPLPEFGLSELRDETQLLTHKSLDGKVTLLNVFGSWCQACLIEHPTFIRLRDEQAFDLVGVNWRDTRPDALRWLERFGDPYAYILFDENSDLAISLGVTGAPETFVVGPDRRIKYKHVGPITDEIFEDTISPLILSLLEQGAAK